MEWLALAAVFGAVVTAFWLGARQGRKRAADEAEKAFSKMRKHIDEARETLDRSNHDELVRRVRGARYSGGSR